MTPPAPANVARLNVMTLDLGALDFEKGGGLVSVVVQDAIREGLAVEGPFLVEVVM